MYLNLDFYLLINFNKIIYVFYFKIEIYKYCMNIRFIMLNNLIKKICRFYEKFSINCVKYCSIEIGNWC